MAFWLVAMMIYGQCNGHGGESGTIKDVPSAFPCQCLAQAQVHIQNKEKSSTQITEHEFSRFVQFEQSQITYSLQTGSFMIL